MASPLLAWLATLALARAPALHPSPEAELVVLPRTVPDRIELGVYHNRAPIAIEVRQWRDPGIDFARVVDTGGGTAFVVIALTRPDLEAKLVRREDHVELQLVPGRPEIHPVDEVPTIAALFEGLPRQPAPWPEGLALVPLMREARTWSFDPAAHRLPVPRMTQHRPEPELSEAEVPTWDDVARWARALPGLRDGRARSAAYYRLGYAHKAMGLPREAAYYFGRAGETGYPPPHVALEEADASLASHQWDRARQACRRAWDRGAEDALVLECLGVLALATDSPAAGPTGRALAAATRRPQARHLAGELLLRDGYAVEAAALLEEAAEQLEGEEAERAYAALADAELTRGDTEGARKALLKAPHLQLDEVLEVREVAVRMLTDGIRRWPAWVPTLTLMADQDGPAGLDALYLLAQVHAQYGDQEAVASALARLWIRGVRRTDVAPRLLSACTERAESLGRDGRDAELLALVDVCWPEGIAQHASDVRLLELASHAWERMGLPDEALRTQLELTTILAGVAREEPLQLGRLAHLQTVNGRPQRAMETLAYARNLTADAEVRHQLDLHAAGAEAAQGHVDAALRWLARAGDSRTLAPIARERAGIVLLGAGRCDAAVRALAPRLRTGPIGGVPPGSLELGWVRCAVELGRPAEAIEAAALVVARAEDEPSRDEARWMATAVAARTGLALPDAVKSAAPTWTAVAAEDERHAAFLAQLSAWSKGAGR